MEKEKYLFKSEEYVSVVENTLGGRQWNSNLITKEIGSAFDAGITTYKKEEPPCVFEHDDYADVIYVIDGEICVKSNLSDDVIFAKTGDTVYLVQKKGLKMTVGTVSDTSKIFWVAYPNCY